MVNNYYYIESYELYLDKENTKNQLVVSQHNNKLVVINSNEDKQKLIDTIKEKEIIDDKEFKKYLDETFPSLSKQIKKIPIDRNRLKKYFSEIYSYEIPDNLFDGDNLITIFKNILSFIIKKIDIDFYLTNIRNGRLKYDKEYPVKEVLHFYYKMIYLNFILEELYSLLSSSLRFQQSSFMKEYLFEDRKISKQELDLFRQLFNGTGKGILNFKDGIIKIQNEIKNNNRRIKRIGNILLTDDYKNEENNLIQITNEISTFCDEHIQITYNQKKEFDKLYFENKGFISLNKVDFILRWGVEAFKYFK